MPAWGNTDSVNDKPHMPLLRQVRDVVTTTVANTGTAAGVLYTLDEAMTIQVPLNLYDVVYICLYKDIHIVEY